jgi:hypothetical protein
MKIQLKPKITKEINLDCINVLFEKGIEEFENEIMKEYKNLNESQLQDKEFMLRTRWSIFAKVFGILLNKNYNIKK